MKKKTFCTNCGRETDRDRDKRHREREIEEEGILY